MLKEDSPSAPADTAQNLTIELKQKVLKPQSEIMTAAACLAAFLMPGMGHVVLRRWGRGLILFGCVVVMFLLGLGMNGALYGLPSGGLMAFQTLNAFANVGVGLPYFIARALGAGAGVITSQTFDYGRVYLAVAGLLNYLIVLDAFDIARGRKP